MGLIGIHRLVSKLECYLMSNDATQWQLKGRAPNIYDRYIAPAVAAPWYPLLMEASRPYMAGPIADIGCGTGSLLEYALKTENISFDTELVGLDLNSAMLMIAENKRLFTNHRVTWLEADAANIPMHDQHFKLVYCQQGIQYFSDKQRAFKEIHRITHPKGILLATVWSRIEACIGYQCLADALRQVVGDAAKESSLAPFSFTNPEDLNELAQTAGFSSVQVKVIDNVVRFASIEAFAHHRIHSSPFVNDLATVDILNIIASVTDILNVTLKAYQTEQGLIFPVKANFLTARNTHESI